MNVQRFDLLSFLSRSYDNADQSELFKLITALGFDLNMQNGPWIAGGAVRRTLMGGGVGESDIDVFFASSEQLAQCRSALESVGAKQKRETDHNIEYVLTLGDSDQRIQLIRVAFHASASAVIDSFDFTICQFATDGKEVICGPYSLWDLSRKRLAVHKITFAVASMRRFLKYSRQGFTVCGGALTDFLQRVVADPNIVHADVRYID
jgi:hypothetical protein